MIEDALWWPCWSLNKGQWIVIPRISIPIGHPAHTCKVTLLTALAWAHSHAKGLL